jgi:hypothetical protein
MAECADAVQGSLTRSRRANGGNALPQLINPSIYFMTGEI